MAIEKPTAAQLKEDLWEEEFFELVEEDVDPSWRHGNYVYGIFMRRSDETYWGVPYQVSGDGEYHSLRDGDVRDDDVKQVWAVTKTITKTVYVNEEPEAA